MSLSATTRPPRGNEVDGREYVFLSAEDFLERKEKDEFAEWAVVHDHYYGTPRQFVDDCVARGESVVFDIDVQGSMQLRERYSDAVLVFVLPPSREVLRERLEGRKTDSPEVVQTRMKNALEEITYIDRFDYLVVNDRLERAQLELEAILQAERLKVGRTDWQGFLGNGE
jgi:guanylate kinase